MIDLRNRSMLAIKDFSKEEILYLLDLASDFKKKKKEGEDQRYLLGKNMVLIFEKTSTRTRASFEIAGFDLGMGVTYLNKEDSQMSKKESIEDTATVLGRYYDAIGYRGYDQKLVEDLAKYSKIPVYNALTDLWHPTQMLTEMLTIRENFGRLEGLNFVYTGDGRNNMANSLAITCAKLGINFTILAPESLWPSDEIKDMARDFAKESGSRVDFSEDIDQTLKDADIIYTDAWVSMGEDESVWDSRIEALYPYQVNSEFMEKAKDTTIFMHCLPAFHDMNTEMGRKIAEKFEGRYDFRGGIEVTDEVFRSGRSVVFDETANRIPTMKALLYATLKE